MEVDDQIRCKFPRISGKLGHAQKMDDEEEDGDNNNNNNNNKRGAAAVDLGGGVGRFYGWPSSRIVRVSRASGGKDRHSKVLTSKGLRDRRVRLSVNTAIQFYDLQDRLGYDQPSKAVEWLLKAAASSIAELPPMNTPFPDTPKQLSDEKRSSTGGSDQLCFDSAEIDLDGGGGGGGDLNYSNQQQVTKSSACSSTSETSKGSGLSLSRSESRIKARERAKERVVEKEKESTTHHGAASLNTISHTTSFTELLSGGIGSVSNNASSPNSTAAAAQRHWSSTPMDYFTSGLLGPPSTTRPAQMHIPANNPYTSVASPLFSVSADHHNHQHFSFVPDHFVPAVNAAAGGNHHQNSGGGQQHNSSIEYNLNFTISSPANSSGLGGFNRGTLQSNSSSPSLLPHLQRYSSDGSAPSFFIGTAESHHQFLSAGYDPRGLQLCYGDAHGRHHAAQRGKGKN
ncbi:hypothetical protein SASPL_130173 [Salvia splendens]|uniref:Transcription factor TCP2 n=1 Tax=Salvia splendens TaxID=180675 RepID=A0A8X8ZKE6_SALSN|nr:transcription factor TCP2-like [Salvia splendens]XP_042007605.1 transcription factor TCP2-like [Salvia splendens]XP_042007606.1 transcription factor TCP2-like [Salvia splendens]XP_042007607.1 transcription factor TCP2-like [Salvia splendens]KAG6407189.1 hypothetical protein SASPL_130173 [Salvia splendens]